jgi:hypothetical protein
MSSSSTIYRERTCHFGRMVVTWRGHVTLVGDFYLLIFLRSNFSLGNI